MSRNTQEIALGLRRRDVELLHDLVDQYQHRLLRYLIYLLGQRDGVEDLVQETWLRVLERGSSYNGVDRFEPWLFTIAHHVAIDGTRRKRTLSLNSYQTSTSEVAAESDVSSAPSPFALAARSEDAERLAVSLETLEPESREALVLRFREDLSLQEISAVVGAPVSTVASRVYRGLARLREQLEGVNHEV